MSTGTVPLSPNAAVQPDGSASNLPAGITRLQGTQTGAKWHGLAATFPGDGTLTGHWFTFRMPADYASGGALKIQWIINATANAVRWQAQVGKISPAAVDTPLEHALAAAAGTTTNVNATEAWRNTETSITLTMDSAAAGDLIEIYVFRDSGDAADTSTALAHLVAASFEYTTV